MKKLVVLCFISLALYGCKKDDEVIEKINNIESNISQEDERAKKAMDMSGGAKVYEIPSIFGEEDKKD